MTRSALTAVLLLALCARAGAESFGASKAKAEKAAKKGELEAAVDYYTDSLVAWTKSDGKKAKAEVYAARADVYEREGDGEKSLADWDSALKLEKKNRKYLRKRGELYLRMNKPEPAISDFYKAVSLDLNDADAYFDRGVAYEMQGDLKFAQEDYRTSCRLGFKKACKNAKEAKEKLLGTRKGAGFEAAEAEKSGPVQIGPAKLKRRYKLDFEACLSSLNACVDAGSAFGQCVHDAKACETKNEAGCCPKSCLQLFETKAEDEGEAAAFRDVFQPKSECLK